MVINTWRALKIINKVLIVKDKIVLFPPLPSIPNPPKLGTDPRQMNIQKILGNEAVPTEGYFAATIDIARIKSEIEKALENLSMQQIKERWSQDVFDWIRAFTQKWIQRRKYLHAEPLEKGIHIYIQTQDDYGYYTYEFDVFPGKH